MPLFDSEPALAEGERKVKRGLTGVLLAVPRIHLPTVRSRLLPRHPHLPPTAWAPRGTLNRPQGIYQDPAAPPGGTWRQTPAGGDPLISRHLLGASTSSKRFRETLEPCQEDAPRDLKPVEGSAQGRKTRGTSTQPIRSEIYAGNA